MLNIFGCPILSPLRLGITYGIEQDLATGGSQFEPGTWRAKNQTVLKT